MSLQFKQCTFTQAITKLKQSNKQCSRSYHKLWQYESRLFYNYRSPLQMYTGFFLLRHKCISILFATFVTRYCSEEEPKCLVSDWWHLHFQSKFLAFYQYAKTFNSDTFDYEELNRTDYVFMRWKEHFLVPDHTIKVWVNIF